jgi:Family of unknown function (DUF6011)
MHDDLNDPLDELFNADPTAARPVRPAPPAHFTPVTERVFTEPCPKCRGTGTWTPAFAGNYGVGRFARTCFGCNGTGRRTFKTPAADRAKARERTGEKRRQGAIDKAAEIAAWQQAHPTVWAWLQVNERKNGTPQAFEFATALYEALFKFGHLTENQLAAAERCIARAAERKAARAAAAPAVNAAGVDRLKQAFDTAIAYSAAKGLTKAPRITIGDLTIKPAKATSANPGALYVTEGGEYLGKIAGGRFFAAPGGRGKEAAVLGLIADPKSAAEVYGRETGVCCVCNATLTSEWRLRGIGPICAEKFGWGA